MANLFRVPKKNVGTPQDGFPAITSNKVEPIVVLKPGDMLVYKGMILEHCKREVFLESEDCAQVFLHYNDCSVTKCQRKYV